MRLVLWDIMVAIQGGGGVHETGVVGRGAVQDGAGGGGAT